ncbi:MAG TPA: hypothetical protein VKY27_08090 [Bacteriovoracaceae bacterium]|nr:hypothetical protein [Bacteriovoracaceae bacterium]
MNKFIELLQEYLIKAIELTETMINSDFSDTETIALMTQNRERLMHIIDQIASYIVWDEVSNEDKTHLNKQIDYIKKLDEKLLTSLQTYKQEVQADIKKTYKAKENIKGYNLNDLK